MLTESYPKDYLSEIDTSAYLEIDVGGRDRLLARAENLLNVLIGSVKPMRRLPPHNLR